MTASPITPELQAALRSLGLALREGQRIGSGFNHIWPMLDMINPACLAQAETEIVREAQLFRHSPPLSFMARLFGRSRTLGEQLSGTDQLEKLFLFHRDGHLREAALRKFDGPIESPFIITAVAWRLNDWVPEVRNAAQACASRCFPKTSALTIAQAALVLLLRRSSWGRWEDEREWLSAEISRPDVASELTDLIIRSPIGPNARVLREALRTPWLDFALTRIAGEAVQPETRAVAYETLISGKARWPTGWRWRWIDKTIGRRRAETVFAERPLALDVSRESLIAHALEDRAGVVRSVAMSGVIRFREQLRDAKSIARRFADDPSRGVRERAEFILRDS